MQSAGAGFAGFAAWLDMSPADSDMFGIPDPDSLIQLPWNKEVGWLASDLWMNGKPVDASPRIMLKKQIQELAKQGLTMKSGVECEYFLISADGKSIADPRDTQSKPCYDQSALMRRYELIKEICDCMIEMKWGPYQNDHEDAFLITPPKKLYAILLKPRLSFLSKNLFFLPRQTEICA